METDQKSLLRRMTPAQKLAAADRLYRSAWDLKAAGLSLQHPDWSAAQVREATRKAFLYAAH